MTSQVRDDSAGNRRVVVCAFKQGNYARV